MIDFEQLRINNVDLNEKIEERNEEIHKLKKKVTSTVQVLAHLKEKLQFVQAENSENDALLKEVDLDVAKVKSTLGMGTSTLVLVLFLVERLFSTAGNIFTPT